MLFHPTPPDKNQYISLDATIETRYFFLSLLLTQNVNSEQLKGCSEH